MYPSVPLNQPDLTVHLLQSLLELTTHEPMVVVMVVNESREKLLDMRFEPVENVAVLMRLRRKPVESTQRADV